MSDRRWPGGQLPVVLSTGGPRWVAGVLALSGIAIVGVDVVVLETHRAGSSAPAAVTLEAAPVLVADLQPHSRPVAPPSSPAPAPVVTTPPPAPVVASPAPAATKAAPAPAKVQAPRVVAAPATSPAPAYTPPTYDVATSTLSITDTSRGRDLPTTVYRPTAAGSYPLVVFAHGWNSSPAVYDILLRHWAAAGYVVAAPTFPNTNSAHATDENDMVNEPADISFVVTQVEAQLGSGLDTSHGVAVTGHSDGAMVALAVGYADRYRDARVTVVEVLEGSAYSQMFGSYSANGAALMVGQSDSDEYNSEADGRSAYAVDAGGTRDFLQLYGAKHLPPYSQSTQWTPPVQRATTAWLDVYLAHRTSDTTYPVTAGTVAGTSTVTRG